jgi:hypothetical protein
MKKLLGIIIILAVLSLIIKYVFALVVGGHVEKYSYVVEDNKFNIVETYTANHKTDKRLEKDKKSYLFDIFLDKQTKPIITFKIVGNYHGYQRVIKDIKYYQDASIQCVYPVLKINYNIDAICVKNNIIYNYLSIKGTNNNLDAFIKDLNAKYGYSNKNWFTKENKTELIENLNVYSDNLFDNHRIIVWTYDGIKVINKNKSIEINFMKSDNAYENKLGTLVGKYYVVPDYKQTNGFNRMFVANVENGDKKEILFLENISFASVIQGVVNNKLYLLDKENNKQYEINPNKSTSIEIGNNDLGFRYYNGDWSIKNTAEIMDASIFNVEYQIPEVYKDYNYYRIDSVNGDTDGYYYLYIKNGNNTKVYRANKQKPEYLTFLFEVDKISNIKYIDDSVYFIKGDVVYGYRDLDGLVPLIKNFELFFNKNNIYDVYNK